MNDSSLLHVAYYPPKESLWLVHRVVGAGVQECELKQASFLEAVAHTHTMSFQPHSMAKQDTRAMKTQRVGKRTSPLGGRGDKEFLLSTTPAVYMPGPVLDIEHKNINKSQSRARDRHVNQ